MKNNKSVHSVPSATMKTFAAVLLFALFTTSIFADEKSETALTPEQKSIELQKAYLDSLNKLFKPTYTLSFDSDSTPPSHIGNPYNVLYSFNVYENPVLDHTGKPHHHGHLIQIIMDGGNGQQDLPLPNGMPGGDDSLAFGNFNMMIMTGDGDYTDTTGATGLFFSKRYFIPFGPKKAYYLRIWEGNSFKTAPYYQDTIEYKTALGDVGGAMVMLTQKGEPIDVEWKFGPSIPRPKPKK